MPDGTRGAPLLHSGHDGVETVFRWSKRWLNSVCGTCLASGWVTEQEVMATMMTGSALG